MEVSYFEEQTIIQPYYKLNLFLKAQLTRIPLGLSVQPNQNKGPNRWNPVLTQPSLNPTTNINIWVSFWPQLLKTRQEISTTLCYHLVTQLRRTKLMRPLGVGISGSSHSRALEFYGMLWTMPVAGDRNLCRKPQWLPFLRNRPFLARINWLSSGFRMEERHNLDLPSIFNKGRASLS